MKDQIVKNLDAVRGEAEALLDNVKAVRGNKYAEMLRLLLNVGQVAKVSAVGISALAEENEMLASKLAAALQVLLTEISRSAAGLGDISDEDWGDVVRDASRMGDNVDALITSAVDAAHDGKSFGESDAA